MSNSNKSPLRYPGGKTRAIKLLIEELEAKYPNRKTLLSPFFGGGSFELYLKSKGYTIYGNDLFKPLITFWKTLQSSGQSLQELVKSKGVITKQLFIHLRQHIMEMEDPLEISAAYYIVNRCSFSGATFCGGFSQEASTKRFNASAIERLLHTDLSDIEFTGKDCIEFLNDHPETNDTVVYADPPYYIENYIYGNNGDMHESFNHVALKNALMQRNDWILCYNDCQYIRDLYRDCTIRSVRWSYGMNATKDSSELFIFPPS